MEKKLVGSSMSVYLLKDLPMPVANIVGPNTEVIV